MARKPQPQPEAAAPPPAAVVEPAAAPVAADTLATLQGVTVPPGDLAADLAAPAALAAPGRVVPGTLDQRPDNPEPGIQAEGSGLPSMVEAPAGPNAGLDLALTLQTAWTVTLIAPAIIDGRRREIGETVEVHETIAAQLAAAQAIALP